LFRLDLGRATATAFERELDALLATIGGLGESLPSRENDDVRSALVRRVGVVIVAIRAPANLIAARAEDLRIEVERWIVAHANAGRPPFCLLLVLEQSKAQRTFNLRFFRHRWPDAEAAVRISLSSLPDLVLRTIDPLRELRAELDLDKWISRTWMALKRRGHEPQLIKARAFEMTYDSSQTKDVTFWQWQRRLDIHSDKIFRGSR
jgi:hypothetical protein